MRDRVGTVGCRRSVALERAFRRLGRVAEPIAISPPNAVRLNCDLFHHPLFPFLDALDVTVAIFSRDVFRVYDVDLFHEHDGCRRSVLVASFASWEHPVDGFSDPAETLRRKDGPF